ncbi:MAG TPA: PEP/pyruvate-binding domain-containing protein [Thermoleophilaceae bacterium]|nr:PEP/pyruvate-binding domain-containing protein [Thermoleophilaceae bacterium]
MSELPLVVDVDAASPDDRALVGGKAHSLVTLSRLGAPVPPGFVLTTEVYRAWAADRDADLLTRAVDEGLARLEARTGRRLGAGSRGLVVSVRSGAPVSMPGMMDTLLNVGLGGLDPVEDERYLHEARARFLWQFAELVLELSDEAIAAVRGRLGPAGDDAAQTARLEQALRMQAERVGRPWPEDARAELRAAVEAVLRSWDSERARLYRRMRKLDDGLGTAVTVQQMVFGNRDAASGSGVAFTRDPRDGEPVLVGEYLRRGQGEDVVSGRATPDDLETWREQQPVPYEQLSALGATLESSSRQVQEIEFTVDGGELYVLQCRPAKLATRAAVRVAVEMAERAELTPEEAVAYATQHGFDAAAESERLAVRPDATPIGRGLAVGGGVGVGRVVVSEQDALAAVAAGESVVFVAAETSPNHLGAMRRSAAVLTMRGGATSHAAVVARELGLPCVVGAGGSLDAARMVLDAAVAVDDVVTVDGEGGAIYAGDVAERSTDVSPEERQLRAWAQAATVLP